MIDCEGVEVSAFTNWYETDRKYNDSINLSKIHHEDDVELVLRKVIDELADRAVVEVSWLEDDNKILTLIGDVSPSWNLQANPVLSEMLNFTLE